MNNIMFFLALICYLASSIIHLVHLSVRKRQMFYVASVCIVLGFVLHSIALVLRSIETGHGPYMNFYEYTNFFAWATVLVYMIVEFKYKINDMGAFIMPVVVILTAVATTFSTDAPVDAPAMKFWLVMHITLSFIGYAAFALTFAVGIMYIIQEKQLKSKNFSNFYYRLPSLDVLDDLNYKVINVGFILLTFGIVTGIIWAYNTKGSVFSWSPSKTIPLIVTWLIYSTLFIGRITVGWRGQKAALLSIVGFFAVIITYLIHIL